MAVTGHRLQDTLPITVRLGLLFGHFANWIPRLLDISPKRHFVYGTLCLRNFSPTGQFAFGFRLGLFAKFNI